MKNLLFTVTTGLLCFLVSCKDSSNTNTSSSPNSQAEKNLANLHKDIKAIETGDMSVLDTIVSEDYIDHLPDRDNMGRETLRKLLGQIHESIQDIKIDVIAASATDDWVFAMDRMTGTTKVPVMGIPANTKLDRTIVRVIKVKKGIFVETWGFVDPRDMIKKIDSVKVK